MEARINSEYAKLVRPLSEKEYEELKQSIASRGLHVPIVVNTSGEILDGHNRFRICQELGIHPQFVTKSFEDPEEEKMFVIESNLKRRQLSDYDRAELGMQLEPLEKELARKRQQAHLWKGDKEPDSSDSPSVSNETNGDAGEAGRVDEIIGDKMGLSPTKYHKLKTVITKGSPEVKAAVREGRLSPHAGYEKTQNKENHQPKEKRTPTLDKIKIRAEHYPQAISVLQKASETHQPEVSIWIQGKVVIGVGEAPEIST